MALRMHMKDPDDDGPEEKDLVRQLAGEVKQGAQDESDEEQNFGDEEPEIRPTRDEKRSNRYKEAQERAEAAEREREQLRQQNQQLANQFSLLQNQFQQQQRQIAPQKSQIDQEIEQVNRERVDLLERHNARINSKENPLTQAEAKEMFERARELEAKNIALIAKKAVGGNQGPSRQEVETQVLRQQLNQRFPDIFGVQDTKYGSHMSRIYASMRQDPDNDGRGDWELAEEAANKTRQKFQMKGAKADPPPKGLRERYVGAPQGRSGGRNDGGQRTVKLSDEEMKMARTVGKSWRDDKGQKLTERQIYERYARRVASKD